MYDFNHVYEPATIEEAIQMKAEHPQAKFIAGGSDLLVQMRAGLHSKLDIISIYQLEELRGIAMTEDGTITIGPLTSFTHITKDPIIQSNMNVLGVAVDKVGGPQIRNIGTIGGNVCNGHTGADSGSTLVALDANIELTGPNGVRIIPIREFYLPTGGVDLQEGELLTKFLFQKEVYEGYVGAHYKYSMRNAMDVDVVGCSINVKLSEDKKTILDARIAYGVLGPIPLRAKEAEEVVRGKAVSVETVMLFADEAVKGIHPRSDMRATKEFREHIAHVIAKRTFVEAIVAAGGVLPEHFVTQCCYD